MSLCLYDSFSREKKNFDPIHPPYVSMYLCGPTVYGPAHLGHARSAITFDIIFRYLKHLKYDVKYIRNITDVGHLERDSDEGKDKIILAAQKNAQEPMALAQYFTHSYQEDMAKLNVLPPTIEPQASGHIIEQIDTIQNIIQNGYGYIKNGSVYFDVLKYHKKFFYGKLSGRVLEDLLQTTRTLNKQKEKKYAYDFALWKKAPQKHIMQWSSPWGKGYPGWHVECTAMSKKYLGKQFDIHGGGMDLLFPHHECEIAQSMCTENIIPAKYWIHNNMIMVDKKKMSKSLNNYYTIKDLINTALTPMAIRMFILQAHYRSTLNFSLTALQASQKAYYKLYNGYQYLQKIKQTMHRVEQATTENQTALADKVKDLSQKCAKAMNDDLNTPQVIAYLFELLKIINDIKNQKIALSDVQEHVIKELYTTYCTYLKNILGLYTQKSAKQIENLMPVILSCYQEAKKNKNYALVNRLREKFKHHHIAFNDAKNTLDWFYIG